LKLARRLESAGFPQRQAGDTAEALAEAMSGAPLATDADIASIRTKIVTLGVGLGAEIAALRAEFRAEIAAARAELKAEIRCRGSTLQPGRIFGCARLPSARLAPPSVIHAGPPDGDVAASHHSFGSLHHCTLHRSA
jgi:hypothetical protein